MPRSAVGAPGMNFRKGLSRVSEIDTGRVEYALAIDVTQDDDERSVGDRVLLRGFGELRPLRGAIVGNFSGGLRGGRSAAKVDHRMFFINSHDVTLPLGFFSRSLCTWLVGRSLAGARRHGAERRRRKRQKK